MEWFGRWLCVHPCNFLLKNGNRFFCHARDQLAVCDALSKSAIAYCLIRCNCNISHLTPKIRITSDMFGINSKVNVGITVVNGFVHLISEVNNSVRVKQFLSKPAYLSKFTRSNSSVWETEVISVIEQIHSCAERYVSRYQRSYSVTAMLFELAIPTFDTIIINAKQRYRRCCITVQNSLVACAVMC